MIKKFSKNNKGRDFIVGDIHGCFDLFEGALADIKFDPEVDRMFSVGDLVDRGPESHRAIEFLSKPWFHSVLGNHEQMCLDAISGYDLSGLHPQNGGAWILQQENPEQFEEAFTKLPIAIEIETDAGPVGIIHAECPVDDWAELDDKLTDEWYKEKAIWSRDIIKHNITSNVEGILVVYHGHTIIKEQCRLGNRIYIDTGAFLPSGKLTVIQLNVA